MSQPSHLCPRCSKPAADGLINIQETVQGAGQVMLWSGCRKCWTVRLQADPILKIVWGAYLEKCRELENGKRRPTRTGLLGQCLPPDDRRWRPRPPEPSR